MSTFSELEAAELHLVHLFEAKAADLNLSDPGAQRELINIIRGAHQEITALDDHYVDLLSKFFTLDVVPPSEPTTLCFFKITSVFPASLREHTELTQHFEKHTDEALAIFEKLLSIINIQVKQTKLDTAAKKDILKIAVDLFKICRSAHGRDLLKHLSKANMKLKITFLGERLIYYPQIEQKDKINFNNIDQAISQLTLEETVLSGLQTQGIANQLIHENAAALGTVSFRSSFPWEVIFNTGLASVKIVIANDRHDIPCLSYCPRFLSTAHELVHIAHNIDGKYYKDVDLKRLPFIKFVYTNLEEFFTIALDKKFSENVIAADLHYFLRISHTGYGLVGSKYTPEKSSEVALICMRALIKTALMMDIVGLSVPVIKKFYDLANVGAAKIDDVHEAYQFLLNQINQEVLPSLLQISTSRSHDNQGIEHSIQSVKQASLLTRNSSIFSQRQSIQATSSAISVILARGSVEEVSEDVLQVIFNDVSDAKALQEALHAVGISNISMPAYPRIIHIVDNNMTNGPECYGIKLSKKEWQAVMPSDAQPGESLLDEFSSKQEKTQRFTH